ncbi:hypothetical protein U9M48_040856 [Paspalum notatum var. saurae]|uniref:BLE2 protein n=1 Tax=Paspalum notatum var. saurae TaxID=547442 RepID=A0AAQ3XE80_PASNO
MNGEEQRQSSASAETAANKVIKKLKWLNCLVLCVALLEWAGNAVGTLATLWATVVLLGGFCSLLSRTDFWFCTVMIFVEATRCAALLCFTMKCKAYLVSIRAFLRFMKDNLIPVSVLQIVLSVLRLRSLLGHHRHDYHPLPEGASHNFVPSIVVFFMLELCQGSFSIFAIFLGVISLPFRRSLVLDLGFTQKLGAKAVDVYFHQAYQVRTEKGLFASEKYRPSLDSFAIKSIGCSSREMQIVGLCILDNCLQRGDSKSNDKLIKDIVKDATNIIPKIIGLISYLTDTRQKEVLCLSLKLVRRIATDGGRIGARFRQDLSENPFFLNNLECILDLENSQPELWQPVMDIIAAMALDKATRQENGSSQAIINRLIGAFLSNNNPGGTATGEALANLTIMSPDNCWAILLPRQGHNLIKTLIDMLEDDNYICVAANILHNLCVNSRDMLINLGADKDLESALPKVMEIIMTKEGKQMEAALSVASQIRYVIHEYFGLVLLGYSDTDAAALVKKLVDTLNSNKEPCPEYPRMRRVLVEMVISIVNRCTRYINIFIENGANDTLDMVKGTPSIFDKYRIFLGGKGVVTESLPMHELVDNAKRLIQATPTPGAQPGGHA